ENLRCSLSQLFAALGASFTRPSPSHCCVAIGRDVAKGAASGPVLPPESFSSCEGLPERDKPFAIDDSYNLVS
ncbi:hypothetical protein Ciccas_002092, partial [Cichlidogyrus casuarinus]